MRAPSLSAWTCLLLGVAGLSLLACGGGGSGGGPSGPPLGLTDREPLAPLGFPGTNPTLRPVELERAFPSLSFDRPVYVTSAPAPDGSAWMYVLEQAGVLRAFRNDDAVTSTHVVMDLSAAASGPVRRVHNEEGLLGLAFDPSYGVPGHEDAGELYLHYSASSPRRSVISRFTATFTGPGGAPVCLPSSEEVILAVGQPYGNHNAGSLEFGSDEMLYIPLGDGGSGNDPDLNGQDLSTLLSSLLRIDVHDVPPGQLYGIPTDNPFRNVAGARDEAWAYGLRNPWRMSFDRATGDLWLGDVGQGAREEINLVSRGDNLGWRVYEGDRSNINPSDLPGSAFTAPVIDYPRSQGTTVVGGYVYRGQDVPTLSGAYVYGDYGSGRIWALQHDGVGVTSHLEIQSLSSVSSFGEDERGELYAVSLNGTIHRFVEPSGGTPPPPFPSTLTATGLFSDVPTLTPAAGLIEYELNSPLWSDDAHKRRWIGLPGTSQIAFDATEPWTFPVGTVLIKHFELDLTAGDVASARRLETRVLLHALDGWAGYTYRWNEAQTEAFLQNDRVMDTFTITDPAAPGGEREQVWTYPSRVDCMQCHTQAAGVVLGVRTGQLHRDRDFGSVVDDQLRAWNHIRLFSTDIGDTAAYERWADPHDLTATLDARARSYLAANCAQCHLPLGPAPGNLDLRHSTARAAMGVVDVRPGNGTLGLLDAWIVRSSERESSVLWERMRRLDSTRMPRIGSDRVHASAVDLIGAWIDSLP